MAVELRWIFESEHVICDSQRVTGRVFVTSGRSTLSDFLRIETQARHVQGQ